MIRFNYKNFESLSGEHVSDPVLTGSYVQLNLTNGRIEYGTILGAITEGLFFDPALGFREQFHPWSSVLSVEAWEHPTPPKSTT